MAGFFAWRQWPGNHHGAKGAAVPPPSRYGHGIFRTLATQKNGIVTPSVTFRVASGTS
jgi:hypothetical protein